jgi:acyl-CoA thioesterase-1
MLRRFYFSRRSGVRRLLLAACCAALLGGSVVGCRSGDASSSAPAPRADSSAARADSTASPAAGASEKLTVLVVGNSLAAGYGISQDEAFPALLQQKADSAGLGRVEVVNAGVSGETTAGGRGRIDWLLRRKDLDVLLLELGGNDALRGLPPDSARANLRATIEQTKAQFPEARVVLAGMKAPPNMGASYARRFEQIYPHLAEETGAALIPFLLEGVAGRPALNQPDGIHPTSEGQRVIARTVWDTLGPLLREMRGLAVPAEASATPGAAPSATG